MTKHNTRLILAFEEIPNAMQERMRAALKKPTPFGATIKINGPDERNIKTSMGYAVHSSFVTPLGAEMVRAADAPVEEAKPKRKAKAGTP